MNMKTQNYTYQDNIIEEQAIIDGLLKSCMYNGNVY